MTLSPERGAGEDTTMQQSQLKDSLNLLDGT